MSSVRASFSGLSFSFGMSRTRSWLSSQGTVCLAVSERADTPLAYFSLGVRKSCWASVLVEESRVRGVRRGGEDGDSLFSGV